MDRVLVRGEPPDPWLNPLRRGGRASARWRALHERGLASFRSRFWDEAGGYLHDAVDVDHRPGTYDPTFRPNQIFAAGGLPVRLVEGERARRIVGAVEERLWTPAEVSRPAARVSPSGGPWHLPEIAEADPPHQSAGCPFQAWADGEALRVRMELDRSSRP